MSQSGTIGARGNLAWPAQNLNGPIRARTRRIFSFIFFENLRAQPPVAFEVVVLCLIFQGYKSLRVWQVQKISKSPLFWDGLSKAERILGTMFFKI